MKLISLTCNHCGAPLDVPKSARFVTCSYCSARLAIHHTGTTYSTELIDEIKQTTETLVRDVEKLKGNSEIDRLDREWDRERMQFMSTNKNGVQSVPTKTPIMLGTGGVVLFGVIWTVIAGSMFPPMALFGILFVAMAIGSGIYGCKKADEFERAKQNYHRQRRGLISERNQQDAAPNRDTDVRSQ